MRPARRQHSVERINGRSSYNRSLAKLFAVVLKRCEFDDPVSLWKECKEILLNNYYQQGQLRLLHLSVGFNDEFNRALIDVVDSLLTADGNDLSFYGLPKVIRMGSHTEK